MPLKILFLLSFSISLFADLYLKNNYYVHNRDVMLSSVAENVKKDVKLFTIEKSRHSKRVKSKKMIEILKAHGLKDYKSKHAYIQFTEKSPIDRTKIETEIKRLYKEKYKSIEIKNISVEPRSYITVIPLSYEVIFKSKSYLSKYGTLYIKTDQRKKIFFNYKIAAKVMAYEAKKDIKRNAEISNMNCKKKSIILDKFRAMPLQTLNKSTMQSKHNIKEGTVLTLRDVQGLYLVKRDSNVNVTLNNSNIAISFSAKAQKNGKYGDTISVMKSNGTKIKVIVTGKHRAEVK